MKIGLFGLVLGLAVARADAASIPEQMHGYVQRYVDAGLFSGTVLVAKHNSVVYQEAFGLAERSFNMPNAIDTKFQIASLSKPITAAAILILVERGKLKLDDRLAKFVPDFSNGENITVEELLTHYSGLGDAAAAADYAEWSRFPQTTESLVTKAKRIPPISAPGTGYAYCNSNYHILAYIIEKSSGQRYGDFLEQNIFKPAGMASTGHRARDETIVPSLATGYQPFGAREFERAPSLDWTGKTGNGSIYSTAHDLLGFDHALQAAVFLKPETIAKSYGFDNKERKVGMFWFRRDRPEHRSVYVNGSSPGFKAHLERFIDDDAAVIVLSNLYIAAPSVIAEDLGAILFGQPSANEVPKPVTVSPDKLRMYTGTFQFGADYFVKNATMRVEAKSDHLEMVNTANGFVISLLPIEHDRFFDQMYWSSVRFEDDKLIYTNAGRDYLARRVKVE